MGQELVSILHAHLREEVLEVVHVLTPLSLRLDLGHAELVVGLISDMLDACLGLASGLGRGRSLVVAGAGGGAAGARTAAARAVGVAIDINLGEVAVEFFVIVAGDIGENLRKALHVATLLLLSFDLGIVLEDAQHFAEVFVSLLFIGLLRAQFLVRLLLFCSHLFRLTSLWVFLVVIGMPRVARTKIAL